MNDDYEGIVSKIARACGAILLGCMALYGAIAILEAIWLPLCILAFVMVTGTALWFGFRYWRGW
ncbi:hypothetical protein [Flexivirga oryzae]|uniref:CHASE2 domain-containing sensor protein n=1 Tax=Flexivirga oryzae TaxID=1794944 RepID=A0A839MZR1_9MICO|nr:hypothetical protein [Flexivirga oryzae]MBB2890950.1 CHASE2 domain-containing sensor protein [Flexivirga oryzae]